MGARFTYCVSFRARHPSLPVADLIPALPEPPGRAWTVGDARTTPTGRPLDGQYRESYCVCDIGEGDDGELAALLDRALDVLRPTKTLLHDLREKGVRFSFFVTWTPAGDSGESFDADLLARMGALGIALDLNVLP